MAVLTLLGLVVIALTMLPLWRTTLWWVRLMDFPRLQIAIVGLVVLVGFLVAEQERGPLGWLVAAGVACAILWQFSWIWPFFPGAPLQLQSAVRMAADPDDEISFITANVLQSNRSSDRLLQIVLQADPDFVLAVETDQWWVDHLAEDLGDRYPHHVCVPQSDGYGMSIFSRLELEGIEVQHLVVQAIPSIRTNVVLRSGRRILVHAVHPQPPSIGQDSVERDVELDRLAAITARKSEPTVVLGDLNDVGWSATTERFLERSALRDPRRGRGLYSTYPARWPGLRYPLDHIFLSRHFFLRKLKVLPSFSSDHLPLFAALRLGPTDSSPGDIRTNL